MRLLRLFYADSLCTMGQVLIACRESQYESFTSITGQMRSLRLFYTDTLCTMGQVVIASRESQYKILHFHHGGLDKLAEIFNDWNLFAKLKDKVANSKYLTF